MTTKPKGDSDVEAVIEAAKQKTRGGHSPIYVWLWKHYDRLIVELAPPISPNWAAMAEQFAKDGVMDGSGKPPTAVTVRQTFAKVARDKAEAPTTMKRRKTRGKSAEPLTQAAPPQVRATTAPTPTTQPPQKPGTLGKYPYDFGGPGGVKYKGQT